MKTGLAQDTTKSAKNLAQQIAKQMAREPLEILKTSREQITGEKLTPKEEQHKPQTEDQQKEINKANMLNDKLKSTVFSIFFEPVFQRVNSAASPYFTTVCVVDGGEKARRSSALRRIFSTRPACHQ